MSVALRGSCALVVACALGGTSIAQTDIRFIPFEGSESASVGNMSRNGTTIVGSGTLQSGASGSIVWPDRGDGMLIDEGPSNATGVSNDGSLVVGLRDRRPYIYSITEGVVEVPSIEGQFFNTSPRVSAVGSTVVGGSIDGAYRWTPSRGTEFLDPPGIWDESAATAVSADGSIIAGFGETDDLSTRQAWTWSESGGFRVLASPGDTITNMTPNAETLVGRGLDGAFRYTVSTRQRVALDGFGAFAFANGISADGGITVGLAADPGQADPIFAFGVATMWFGDDPTPVRLQEYLEDRGVDLGGWWLQRIEAISDDGRVLAGTGYDENLVQRPFVVVLPSPGGATLLAVLPLATQRRRRSR